MKARREELLDRLDGRTRRVLEVRTEIELELLDQEVRSHQLRGKVRNRHVHCSRARGLHVLDGAPNDGANFLVFRRLAEELAEYADSCAFECIAFQRRGVRPRDLPPAGCGHRIGRVVAHCCVKDGRDVLDRSGHRPPGILCVAERDDARSARQDPRMASGRRCSCESWVFESNRSCRSPWRTSRSWRRRRRRSHRSIPPGARVRSYGFQCLPAERADRGEAERELVKVDLAEDYRAGLRAAS